MSNYRLKTRSLSKFNYGVETRLHLLDTRSSPLLLFVRELLFKDMKCVLRVSRHDPVQCD